MHNADKMLGLAQTACIETFHVNAHIVAQPANWHDTAKRLTNVAYGRVSDICRDVDGSPEAVALAQDVAFPLISAIQYFDADMYGMAVPHLNAASSRFAALLAHLAVEAQK